VAYLQKLSVVAAKPACMRVGVEGCEQETVRAQIEMKRRGTQSERGTHRGHGTRCGQAPCEAGAVVRRGRSDASPYPDIRVLTFPYLLQCTTHIHVVITLCLTPLTETTYSRRDYYAACTINGHMERKMNEQTKQ
jgi:hypothetical protein